MNVMLEVPLENIKDLDLLLQRFVDWGGSDLYITVGVPPSVRVSSRIVAVSEISCTDESVNALIDQILNQEQKNDFATLLELNISYFWKNSHRFRVNIFRQQQHSALVIRRIQAEIPTTRQLGLPKVYEDIIMEPRGLVLVSGPTGAGKSSSIAAMIGHRNRNGFGHIVTIEDPIEFVHQHMGCIITQRDVGVDTYSLNIALKNALRQRPDVVLIGEIRDRETLEHALHFSETGHLCISTVHAGNVVQTIERVLNFFPQDKHTQLLYFLSQNLKAILCQRLVMATNGKRAPAIEVMLNRGMIRNLIQEEKIKEILELMSKNHNEGMITMDESLYNLYQEKVISEEVAIAEADNPANLRLQIRQSKPATTSGASLSLRNTSNTF